MSRSELVLTGSAKTAGALRQCQSKTCAGAERTPEGGVQIHANKWVCASCWTTMKRRFLQ